MQAPQEESAGKRTGKYDVRGLADPDATAPNTAIVTGTTAELDAAELSTRQINLELRRLLHTEGVTEITLHNPRARHSIAVGLLLRCRIKIEGSLGYFGCGIIDGPEIHIAGRVGWSVAENMMSGVVVIDKNAGSLTGAAFRGGDLVVRGHVGARTGIDQKGGTIIVGGNAGSMTGFMMQRGRQIICGDVGHGMGDSMYDGSIYVAGKVASLGVDCVEAEMTDADNELIDRKFASYRIDRPDSFRKFVCGRKLWNYDNLEPNERKLVL
ncbi:MAG: GXGXG motif-containing protein [Actinophytocola sp.]|nr:GXGXG motif-containing protein [Actinophytocola sp.]